MKKPRCASPCQSATRRQVPAILACGIIALSAPVLHAATFTWLDTNTGDPVPWSTGAWTPAAPTAANSVATTDLIFNGAGAISYTATNDLLPTPFLLNTLTLNSTASVAETLAGAGFDFRLDDVAAGIVQSGSGAFVINSDILVSSPLTLSGAGTGVVSLNGVVSGTGAINVTAGNWQLGNVANTFNGSLMIGTGAFVEVLPSGFDPQPVNLTAANPGILSNSAVTINGGTLKITTKGASGNGSGITIGGRMITFGPNGGAFDLRNTSGTPGSQGGGILTGGGGDLNLTLNNTAGNPAVVFFNGGQNGHSTGSATDGNWSTGNNVLRVASFNGTGSVRIEITNGAMLALPAANVPVTVRGVLGGDPTSGPTASVNAGISTNLGRIAINANSANFSQGIRLEDAIQIHSPGTTRAMDGSIVVAGSAGGHPGYIVFNGRSTGTALGAAINTPGNGGANQNPLWIGQGQNDTLTIENGGTAVFDLRIRYEQPNHNGVLLDGRAVINAGGLLRMGQSISNTSFDPAGLANPNTTSNVGDHVIRGDIEGQGTTTLESIVDIQLPAPTAAGGAGIPAILTGAPAAGDRPLGGLRFEDTTGNADLIINGTGFGGLRVTATARPDRLFSPAGPDPVTNASKINDALPGFRLARLTGSGGYLTLAPANETYTFPNTEWAVSVPVGLRVANHNATGIDVQFEAGKSTWEHNLAVDSGAQLFTGTTAFTQTGGTLSGSGMVLGLGGVTIATNATVSPGFGVGVLTISENLTLNGTFFADLASTTSDVLAVTGSVAIGAGSTLALGGTFGTTDLIIASYTGTLTGTFTNIMGLNPEFTVNYGTGTNSNIRLVYTPAPISTWNGNLSGTWSTNAADQNWKGPTGYIQSNSAIFDDTATGPNLTVTVTGGNVTPANITVNNSTKNYTLVSSAGAAITGGGKLIKTGTASLTLSGPASYQGGTQVTAGTLILGSSNALPDVGEVAIGTGATLDIQGNSDTVPTLTVNGSAVGTGTLTVAMLNLGSGAVFAPKLVLTDTLSKTGALGTTLAGTIDLGGGARTFNVAAGTAPELTINGVISNGTLTKTGNGTLILGTVNSLTTVNANGGTLRVGILGAIPNGGEANTGAGGTLDLNGLLHTFTTLNNSGTTTTGNKPLTVNALNGANTGVLNMGGSQLTLDDGGGGAYAGSITGVGTVVVKQGGGIAALSGLNTHTGGTVVNAGRLDVSGTPGGSLGTTVNPGAVLQFTNTANGIFHVNGATVSSTTGNNPVNGEIFFDAPSNVHLFNEGNPGAAAEFNLNGTLRGTADFTISSNQAGADGGVGFRLRGTAASDYSGTITLNPAVKLELQSVVGGNFSPLGTGKVKMTAGVANGNLNGTYTQIQTRGNLANSTTMYGNNVEIVGPGIVNFNVLGAANTTAVMGDLKIGADQSMFFNKNDAAIDRTLVFQTVTLTGGNATFSVSDRSFRANNVDFVGPNVQLGAIGQSTPGSGVIFKAQGGDTAVAFPLPHVTITGVSTYTGPTDIQTGSLSVSFDGSIASSSEIKLSSTASKLDVVSAFTGYAIPAAQKVSGIGDWDGRLLLSGTMAPGLDGLGTLAGDDLTIHGGGIMQFQLSTANSTSDLLSLTASFDKGTPGNFVFDFESGGSLGQTYTLVQFLATTFSVTDFSFIDLAPGLTGSFLLNPNDLKFVVIPEPASASALAASLALVLGLRRRRLA